MTGLNKDHSRPQMDSGLNVGDMPRTIDAEIPPLVKTDSPIEGTDFYRMGECTVHHRLVEGGMIFPGHYLSVSHPLRYPTWDEVAEARYRLVPDDVYMVMPLPPSDQYLNLHPYMFNLHEINYTTVEQIIYDPYGRPLGTQVVKVKP